MRTFIVDPCQVLAKIFLEIVEVLHNLSILTLRWVFLNFLNIFGKLFRFNNIRFLRWELFQRLG